MGTLPCGNCKGFCCGPVPVTEQELRKIKKKVKTMPPKLLSHLKNQTRHFGTCIFLDLDKNTCAIYSVRPEVCKMFGYHKELPCMFNPKLATNNLPKQFHTERKNASMLSIDYTWKDFH